MFAAAVLPACLFIAWLNNYLYGSPLTSGYGGADTLFALANVLTNLRRYGTWLIDSQTPLAVAGLCTLVLPFAVLWPTREWRRAALMMAAMVSMVWGIYLDLRAVRCVVVSAISAAGVAGDVPRECGGAEAVSHRAPSGAANTRRCRAAGGWPPRHLLRVDARRLSIRRGRSSLREHCQARRRHTQTRPASSSRDRTRVRRGITAAA